MNRSVLILSLVTALAAVGAWLVARERAPATDIALPLLYPDLVEHVNEVVRVAIHGQDGHANLTRDGDVWRVENRHGYPAKFESVKRLVVGLAGLRVLERKTREPERYATLGVEDTGPRAGSRRVTLTNAQGVALASLLVGKPRMTQQLARARASVYVRKHDDPQALLVEGEIDAPTNPIAWMDQTLLDIDSDRIAALHIRHADGSVIEARRKSPSTQDFELVGYMDARTKPAPSLLIPLATALEDLRFDDVASATRTPLPDAERVTAVYTTFDGVEIEITSGTLEGRRWSQIHARVQTAQVTTSPPAQGNSTAASSTSPQDEVTAIAKRSAGWIYALPDYKLGLITKKLADLNAPTPTSN